MSVAHTREIQMNKMRQLVIGALPGKTKDKFLLTSYIVLLAICFLVPSYSSPSSIDDVLFVDRYGRKTLVVTSQIVNALEIAKMEARTRNVNLLEISNYSFVIELETITVFLTREYKGGFDGPELRVVLNRTDLSVKEVLNTLE
jgi:hypothetical protein